MWNSTSALTALLSELSLSQSSLLTSGSKQDTIRGIANLLKKLIISPAVIGSAIASIGFYGAKMKIGRVTRTFVTRFTSITGA